MERSKTVTFRDVQFVDDDKLASGPAPFGRKLPAFMSESGFVDSGFGFDDEEEVNKDGKVEAKREVKAAVKCEIFGVRFTKALFIVIALSTAVLVSVGTYLFLRGDEEENFEQSYALFVSAINASAQFQMEHVHMALESMASTISSDAGYKGIVFPFYTMGNFEAVGQGVRETSGMEILAWMPLVELSEVKAWLDYSQSNQTWLERSRQWTLMSGEFALEQSDYQEGLVSSEIFDYGGPNGSKQLSGGISPFAPMWQTSPPVFDPETINFDFNFLEYASLETLRDIKQGFFTPILQPLDSGGLPLLIFPPKDHDKLHVAMPEEAAQNQGEDPHGAFLQPVFVNPLEATSRMVGYIAAVFSWDVYMASLLPDGAPAGIDCVVRNTCGQAVTYRLNTNGATFVGWDDLHESGQSSTELVLPFHRELPKDYEALDGQCIYSLYVYSTNEFEESYKSDQVVSMTVIVAMSFFILFASYFLYDWMVNRRNSKIVALATKTNEIVASLFPSNIRDRLYKKGDAKSDEVNNEERPRPHFEPFDRFVEDWAIKEAADGEEGDHTIGGMSDYKTVDLMDEEGFMYKSKPIADVYPETTIMFADISGFTAWSSTREPRQVFTLLETIYKAFDRYAKRRRVFKVETIGDCYVACAGIPDPMPNHALVMCRFARDCLFKFHDLTRRLESILGPDTMDLDLRIGLHSGTCTAGVLRGEKSRFQLFGDTMNTASRMESNGKAGMIHISQETADLIAAAGKNHWLRKREDKIHAKGKGELQTYFVMTSSNNHGRDAGHPDESASEETYDDISGHAYNDGSGQDSLGEGDMHEMLSTRKGQCLLKWHGEVFTDLLTRIAGQRYIPESAPIDRDAEHQIVYGSPLDEFQDSIDFPEPTRPKDASVEVSFEALKQLELFIGAVASNYSTHPYHDFNHASHVALSVCKFLTQLKTDADGGSEHEVNPAIIISSDPTAQLACVLSGLVQDIQHPGVPNCVLVHENSPVAKKFTGRCVTEQRSVEFVWNLLMENDFNDLRNAIYRTEEEKRHFRQVFVQCVLATDFSDEELAERRKSRWDKAFGQAPLKLKTRLNLQATLILETIVQASDMIHTMQHWDIYYRWSALLFEEVNNAYKEGRISKSPGDLWYKGEQSLFGLVFQMTNRLGESGAFKIGTVDECIHFAKTNLCRWKEEGEDIVAELLEKSN